MKFLIKGTLKIKNGERSFEKEIDATSKNHAIQKIKAIFGGTYKLKENRLIIEKIEEKKE
jgi:ribosomal protein L20A (L18A)